jgi:hypothetical protein
MPEGCRPRFMEPAEAAGEESFSSSRRIRWVLEECWGPWRRLTCVGVAGRRDSEARLSERKLQESSIATLRLGKGAPVPAA